MIHPASQQQEPLRILTPQNNKVLSELLKTLNADDKETLSSFKSLPDFLQNLAKESLNTPKASQKLLELLQNNPTLKSLAQATPTLQKLSQLLVGILQESKNQVSPKLAQLYETVEKLQEAPLDKDAKSLQQKVAASGIFLESKLKNNQTQQLTHDLKALILQTKEEIAKQPNLPHRQELTTQLEKLSLHIDYYQLLSHASQNVALYIPYNFDALKDGKVTFSKTKKEHFFCDIELELKEYGELFIRIGLFEEKSLYITMATKSKELTMLLKEQLKELKSALFDAGVHPKNISFEEKKKAQNHYTQEHSLELGFKVDV